MKVIEKDGKKSLVLNDDFDETLRSSLESHKAAEEAAVLLEMKARNLREVASVLDGLADTWKERDPGKYRPSYTFMNEGNRNVVASELVTGEDLPPYVKTAPLEKVKKRGCPECGKVQPLIERYYQTYDGPSGDRWEKSMLVVCCGRVQVISTQVRDHRF